MHGNKPSRGAEIDKQLQEEDAATLKKMRHQEDFSEKGKHSGEGHHHGKGEHH
jgi:hypothetical protein